MRWYLVGLLVLVTLAGCGRGLFHYAQREPWREQAEVACMRSGAVREGNGVVRIAPIEGPGICGATIPLKVAVLGQSAVLGYGDEALRPPGTIPRVPMQPRWPVAPAQAVPPVEPRDLLPPGEPLSLNPPGIAPPPATLPHDGPGPDPTFGPPADRVPPAPTFGRLTPGTPPPRTYDDDDDLPRTRPSVAPPRYVPPPLGPQRGPLVTASAKVDIKPHATLACPIVSALDRWIVNAVQPAAQKWFGQNVVEIRQISAYSCRGMNGQIGARISEHAFGNALDIAAFVLADGHRITVKNGWRGTPEEQGFLRDVQAAACDQFTTVLAPGSNRFHYDHIHVDLMRRKSGRRICQPGAVDGELIAARARRGPATAAARREPPPLRRYDPPFDARNDPFAWRGDAVRRADPATTGSIALRSVPPVNPAVEDDDWIEDEGPRPPIDWGTDRYTPQ